MQNNKKIFVIDGNSLLFRAFFATSMGDTTNIMRTSTGIPTNAIFAFSNMISKIMSSMKLGDSIFIAFDADSHTFRKEEFDQYKANRKPTDPALIEQFPISREFLDALSIVHYEEHGIEADDIAGTVAKMASKEGYTVEIYTSDKDYLQLIDDHITVNLLKTGLSNMEPMTEKAMLEHPKFGYKPAQIIDFKGLRGDASDNLPGIPGIGDKGAVDLIKKYGSLDAIIDAAKKGEIKGKLGEKIVAGEEMGRTCYRLATIMTDAKLPFTLDDLIYDGYSFETINEFAQKYEFKNLVSKLPSSYKKKSLTDVDIEFVTVESFKDIKVPEHIGLSLDLEEEDYNDAPIEGISIAFDGKAYYESVEDLKKDETLKAILKNPDIKKNVYDGKLVEVGLARLGLEIKGISFDVSICGYLLDSSITGGYRGVYAYFGMDVNEKDEAPSLFEVGHPKTNGKIASFALAIEDKAISLLRQNDALKLYEEVEFPLSHVLAKMEIEGFPLDGKVLSEFGDEFKAKVKSLEKEIYEMAGHPFNISSPKQVGEVLYGELSIGDGKEKSTSVDTLKYLSPRHPIIAKILEYRKYAKLVSTYIEGFLPHIKEDGKIHTIFNQTETRTGRLSSSNPNLQNISARDEEGKLIRKAFYYPDENYQILSLDYSQIELRILAALSNCKDYIDVFMHDRDVHSETAKKIFGTEEVTPLMRRRAKAVNFAIIYGSTAFGLAEQIDGTPGEAKRIIDSFYRSYPEIGDYLSSIIDEVERKGYVTTMFGRRRYLRDITDPNYAKREAAKRQALNAPVQGSAADLIKIAMLHIDKFLSEKGYKTKMVLQIHDELLFKVPHEEADEIIPLLSALMTTAVELPVKLSVEGSLGKTWYDAKD